MNDFQKLSNDELVEITGMTDEEFDQKFEKDEEGYFRAKQTVNI